MDQQQKLSDEEIRELKEIFCLVDLDGGGTISKDELASLMISMGLEASKAELTNLVNEIDLKGTGEIEFDTFVEAMSRKVKKTSSQDEMRKAFKKFEKPNRPGQIQLRELFKILTEYGSKQKIIGKEEAGQIIRQIAPELHMDDYFDYENYINYMYSN